MPVAKVWLRFAGTQHGDTLKLPRQGVQKLGAMQETCGDHHVTVKVVLPVTVSAEEAQLLQQLSALQGRRYRHSSRANAQHAA